MQPREPKAREAKAREGKKASRPRPSASLGEMLSGSIAREASVQRPPSARSPQAGGSPGERDGDTRLIERERIEPNPAQPRRLFAPSDLRALGESLRRDGQLQAIVVRPHPARSGHFQIVSGERRWRASAPEYADIPTLRATIRDISDEESLRLALIENIQRTDLSPIEVARGLQALKASSQPSTQVDEAANSSGSSVSTQVDSNEALGRLVGFTRARVQQLLALLELPPAVQKKIEAARLNEKHGRALLMLKGNARAQGKLLRDIEHGSLSGNEALKRAQSALQPRTPRSATGSTAPQVLEGQAKPRSTPESAGSRAPDVLGEHLLPAVELAERAAQALADAPASTQVDASAQVDVTRMREAARRLHEAARRIRKSLGDGGDEA